jgi:hypothetical protein
LNIIEGLNEKETSHLMVHNQINTV